MVDIKKFTNMDLYGMLGVEIAATDSDVSNLFQLYQTKFIFRARQDINQ